MVRAATLATQRFSLIADAPLEDRLADMNMQELGDLFRERWAGFELMGHKTHAAAYDIGLVLERVRVQDGIIQGTDWTFVLSNAAGTYNYTDDGGAITLTVPQNVDVPFPQGSQIIVEQGGAGQITIVGDTNVTVNSANGLKSSAQYAVMTLIKKDTNVWTLTGSTTT